MLTNFNEKYELLDEELGQGAFGFVKKCEERSTGKHFAVKCLKKLCVNFEEFAQLNEIAILRKIPSHPNVISLYESYMNRTTGEIKLLFQLMDQSLYDYIVKTGCIAERKAKRILFQILNGLNHLHTYKVFHRDIKPENILLKGENVVIGDLGSSKRIGRRQPYTDYIATRWYRAPECILTRGFYSAGMDIWATGCLFYEMITSEPLFQGQSELDQIDKIHKILGTPSPKTLLKFEKHKSKISFNFEQYPGISLMILFPNSGRFILQQMLTYDHEERPTAQTLLNHTYFSDLRTLKYELSRKQVVNNLKKISGQIISHPQIPKKTSIKNTIPLSHIVQSEINTTNTKGKPIKRSMNFTNIPLLEKDVITKKLRHQTNAHVHIKHGLKQVERSNHEDLDKKLNKRKSEIVQKLHLSNKKITCTALK